MRTRVAGLALAAALIGVAAEAAVPPPPKPPQSQPLPAQCDPKNSADYVPGLDVHGKAVAPADLPSNAPDVVISTRVYPTVPSQNPRQPGSSVAVQLNGLGAVPHCQPIVNERH
jgi:hypothetical protein